MEGSHPQAEGGWLRRKAQRQRQPCAGVEWWQCIFQSCSNEKTLAWLAPTWQVCRSMHKGRHAV